MESSQQQMPPINKGLNLNVIEYRFENEESKSISLVKDQKSLLKFFYKILPTGTRYKLVISALTTIVAPIIAVYSFIEKNFDKQNVLTLDVAKVNLFSKRTFLIYMFLFLPAILSFIVSCFIRKREILLQNGIYEKEHILSNEVKGQLETEFP